MTAPAPAAPAWRRVGAFAGPVMLATVSVVAAFVYARLLRAPFLGWDDDRNIVMNQLVTAADFNALWSAPQFGLYIPATSMMWALLWQVGAGSAVAFRVANSALHLATTWLVWRLLVRLGGGEGQPASGPTGGVPPELAAAIGATVFALHPLQTAAVAWISGGRDLLAAFFAVGAVLLWVRGTRSSALLATVAFGLGLLAKPSVAAVPVAVVAWCVITGSRSWRRAAPLAVGWMCLAGVAAVVTARVQGEMTGLVVPWADRPAIVADALGFYILKILAPVGLAVDHGRTPSALAEHAVWMLPTFVAVAVLAICLVRPLLRRRVAAGWTVAGVVLLLPTLGAIPFAYQRISTVADHYAYLPMVAVAGLVSVVVRRIRRVDTAVGVGLAVMVVCAAMSWSRLAVWRNDRAFFTDMVQRNPVSFSGLTNLAKLSCDAGDARTGAALAGEALGVNATNPATLATRADCLYRSGAYGIVAAMRPRLASPAVERNLDHDAGAAASFVNTIAGALFQRGDFASGLRLLCQAIAVRPDDAYLRENFSDIAANLSRQGRPAECAGRILPWRDLAVRNPTRAPGAR